MSRSLSKQSSSITVKALETPGAGLQIARCQGDGRAIGPQSTKHVLRRRPLEKAVRFNRVQHYTPSNLLAMASNLLAMASDLLIAMASNLLNSDGLQQCDGLQPISDGLQIKSDGLQPSSVLSIYYINIYSIYRPTWCPNLLTWWALVFNSCDLMGGPQRKGRKSSGKRTDESGVVHHGPPSTVLVTSTGSPVLQLVQALWPSPPNC